MTCVYEEQIYANRFGLLFHKGGRSPSLVVYFTPSGLARKIFPEDFLASLPLKSKSFMQYVG